MEQEGLKVQYKNDGILRINEKGKAPGRSTPEAYWHIIIDCEKESQTHLTLLGLVRRHPPLSIIIFAYYLVLCNIMQILI